MCAFSQIENLAKENPERDHIVNLRQIGIQSVYSADRVMFRLRMKVLSNKIHYSNPTQAITLAAFCIKVC